MISRRLLLIAAVPLAPAAVPLPVPAGNRLAFQVMHDGSIAGEHTITFERSGDVLTVFVTTEIAAGAGPIALFRYKHCATERWKNGQVIAIDTETNDNGIPAFMTVWRNQSGLVVERSRTQRHMTPPRSLPGTHWNRAMLDAPFINIQDGCLMRPVVTLAGAERVDVVGGAIKARHYTLRGGVNLDTFYDLGPVRAGMRSTGKDGSAISYLRA